MTDSRFASKPGSLVRGALSALVLLLAASPAKALTLASAAATDFDAKVVADSLNNPTDVAELPDGRFVVIEREGGVKVFTPGMDDPVAGTIMVNKANNQLAAGEQGLLGVVVDPDFATNQFLYFYVSAGPDDNNRQKIVRYKMGADSKLTDAKSIIDMGLMGPANHNGGALSIYGGNLFVGVGDTGKNATPPRNHFASCLNHANGKILRVSLKEETLGQPPADNPLMDVAMATGCDTSSASDTSAFTMKAPDKRVWAWGTRNPFRIWNDPTNGTLWIGDVGETTKEELSIATKGAHMGYPFWEGTKDWTGQQTFATNGGCMGMTPAVPCTPALYDYDTPQNASVIGGRILDGCGWPDAWKSRFIFGDYNKNKVWTIDVNATRDGVVANSVKDFASANGPTAFRMGTDNALYVVEFGAKTVTRITAKAAPEATPGSCASVAPPPGSGAGPGPGGEGGGGAGGSSGAAGSGTGGASAGSPATGGSAGATGGSPSGTSGSTSTAGTSAGTGTGNTSSGGTSPTTGAGTGNNADNPGADDGGCGCRVAGGAGGGALGIGVAGAALALVLGRRRNRR